MQPIVRFTLRQRVLFNLLFAVLIIAGSFALLEVPVERYPEVNFGKVLINVSYPGASPRDVESLVTMRIEEALDGLQEVELIRSSSVRENATILVKFRDDTDYDALYDELRFRVLGMLDELPDAAEPPRFELIRTSFWLPVVSVNLVGERSNRSLSLMAEELKVPLSRIPGVVEAELVGEQTREYHVYLDPIKLSNFGISFDEAAAALVDANLVIPAGDYADATGEYVVRVNERFSSREQVVSTVVRRDSDGSFVTIEDLISEAGAAYRDPHVIISVNGRDAVTLKLLKNGKGNSLDIYRAVQEIVAEHESSFAKQGVELVLTQDSTTYIEENISTLGWNLALGIVLVSLILWYFMGLRNAALVTIGIPFSFMVTMILMQLSGSSLNEITLFSFVLVSGIIVDDAIVVIENIYRHIQNGKPLEESIVKGTAEVLMPVISATLTTVAAFLPMLIMTGAIGEFFALIPKAVTFAIVASLFECLFILPVHYLDYGPRRKPKGKVSLSEHDNLLLKGVRALTTRTIGFTLRWRWTSLISVTLAFVAAVAILVVSIAGTWPLIRIKFFPDDYSLYYAFVEGPANTTIETIDAKVREIAELIAGDGPAFARSAAGFAGFVISEDYEEKFAHHLGAVMVALPADDERGFSDPLAHLERMRERLQAQFERDGFEIRVRAEKDGPPTGKDVNIRVVGSDERAVKALTAAMFDALASHSVFAQHLIQLDDGRARPARVYRMEIDEARAHEHGLTSGQATRLAASVLDGRYIGDYRLGDEEVDLKIRIDPKFLTSPQAALGIPAIEHPSGPVYLRDIVHPVVEIQPGELSRYRGQRSLAITANINPGAPISPAQIVAWADEHYRAIRDQYPGAALVYGGEFEDTRRSFESLAKAFALAILLIYLILASQFRSYAQPLIILTAVMFSIIGIVLGNLVSQSLFTINSFIAVVGVTGVVVNDSLVLLDFINRRYRSGTSRAEAIRDGVQVRLRPIVLTTLTTTLGLLPMALGIPSYSVVWGSMASTFVTGLATATLLTLFLVPVGWDLIIEGQEKKAARRATTTPAAD